MNKKIYIVRRSLDFDGGAERALLAYIHSLEKQFDICLVSQKWPKEMATPWEKIKIPPKGLTRVSKYKSFVSGVIQNLRGKKAEIYSLELIPGSTVLRLGDGLHSSWLDIQAISQWKRNFSFFHKLKLRYEKESLLDKRLKKVIVNSQMVGDEVRGRYGISEEKILLIRNIVRREFIESNINSTPPKHTMLFVGSGWHRKGLALALETLSFLPDEWKLLVVGKDKSSSKYQKIVKRLGLQERVTFLGRIKVTPHIYQRATLLIHPALYEPFPNVATEALSQGVPVVSSVNSGTSDFEREAGVWTVKDFLAASWRDAVLEAANIDMEGREIIRDHICQFNEEYLRKKLEELNNSLNYI